MRELLGDFERHHRPASKNVSNNQEIRNSESGITTDNVLVKLLGSIADEIAPD